MANFKVLVRRTTNTRVEASGGQWRIGEPFIDRDDRRGPYPGIDPPFNHVYIDNAPVTLQQAKDFLLEFHYVDDDPSNRAIVARRKRTADSLPSPHDTNLANNGFTVISWDDLGTGIRTRVINSL
jgi:hypothetical protein